MPSLLVRDAGTWKEATEIHVRDGGVWKQVEEGFVRDGGVWKTFFTGGFEFEQTISSNTTDYSVYDAAIAAGWDGETPIKATITIDAGVFVVASSVGVYAFETGMLPSESELTLINNGTILGRGGNGGSGAVDGGDGTDSGSAFFTNIITSVVNNHRIASGGGGGGGAGFRFSGGSGSIGGGGGGGIGNGLGGPSDTSPGSDGTLTSAGAGGVGTTGSAGGDGGGYGSSGGSGGGNNPGSGGLAGNAVVGNNNITWIEEGTINGGIVD